MNGEAVCSDSQIPFGSCLQDLIARTRGNDALRCQAEVLDNHDFYRCSRDSGHQGNHLCIDFGVSVRFDDWAAGLEDEVPYVAD